MIYEVVSQIPEGKVLTYGSLAKLAGIKNPRVVGTILHRNPDPKNTPCHRVVSGLGKVAENYAFGGAIGQIERLKREGVDVEENRVALNKYLWKSTKRFLL